MFRTFARAVMPITRGMRVVKATTATIFASRRISPHLCEHCVAIDYGLRPCTRPQCPGSCERLSPGYSSDFQVSNCAGHVATVSAARNRAIVVQRSARQKGLRLDTIHHTEELQALWASVTHTSVI